MKIASTYLIVVKLLPEEMYRSWPTGSSLRVRGVLNSLRVEEVQLCARLEVLVEEAAIVVQRETERLVDDYFWSAGQGLGGVG